MSIKKFIHDNIGFIELIEVFGNDLTVVNAARVSFNKESSFEEIKNETEKVINYKLPERDKKLINYLAKHNHITPFFHPQLRFRIKMPYFIMREWFRHTVGFSRNEVSRRYVDTPPEFFIPDRLRQRDPNLKQGSKPDPIPQDTQERERMQEYFIRSREYNNYLLSIGVCPEQARIVLPQAMYNEFIETASLYGYARLANLRLDSSAQKEIFYYAKIISEIIEPYFPVSWNALVKKTSETAHQDSHIDMPSL